MIKEVIFLLLTIGISSMVVCGLTIYLFTKFWNDYFILNRKYNVELKKEERR